jgi:hypothetical protein
LDLDTVHSENLIESAIKIEPDVFLQFSTNGTASFVIQKLFSHRGLDKVQSRNLLNQFQATDFINLCTSAGGSHVAEACWKASIGLKFIQERFASYLADNPDLKFDKYGRRVWKVWHMDQYIYAKWQWNSISKGEKINRPRPNNFNPPYPAGADAVRGPRKTFDPASRSKHNPTNLQSIKEIAANVERLYGRER